MENTVNTGLSPNEPSTLPSSIATNLPGSVKKLVENSMDDFVSKKAYEHLYEGCLWRENNVENIEHLSRENIKNVRTKVGSLTDSEKGFIDNFFKKDFYMTHFTMSDALGKVITKDGRAELFSQKQLKERKIQSPEGNTYLNDLKEFANDDFVFFALEVGDKQNAAQDMQNASTGFGDTKLRFQANGKTLQRACMTLLDMALPHDLLPLQRRLKQQGMPLKVPFYDVPEKWNRMERIFQGPDIIPGLAYSLITNARKHLDPKSYEKMLAMRTDEEMTGLVNAFYRPEIQVPHHFFAKPNAVHDFSARATPGTSTQTATTILPVAPEASPVVTQATSANLIEPVLTGLPVQAKQGSFAFASPNDHRIENPASPLVNFANDQAKRTLGAKALNILKKASCFSSCFKQSDNRSGPSNQRQ